MEESYGGNRLWGKATEGNRLWRKAMGEIGYGGKLWRKSVMEESYGGNWLWRKATEEIGNGGKLRRKLVMEESYGGNWLCNGGNICSRTSLLSYLETMHYIVVTVYVVPCRVCWLHYVQLFLLSY